MTFRSQYNALVNREAHHLKQKVNNCYIIWSTDVMIQNSPAFYLKQSTKVTDDSLICQKSKHLGSINEWIFKGQYSRYMYAEHSFAWKKGQAVSPKGAQTIWGLFLVIQNCIHFILFRYKLSQNTMIINLTLNI